MKATIYKDEWYPVFTIDRDSDENIVEIPEDVYLKYEKIDRQFKKMQKVLKTFYERRNS